jgi:hypothetical protein
MFREYLEFRVVKNTEADPRVILSMLVNKAHRASVLYAHKNDKPVGGGLFATSFPEAKAPQGGDDEAGGSKFATLGRTVLFFATPEFLNFLQKEIEETIPALMEIVRIDRESVGMTAVYHRVKRARRAIVTRASVAREYRRLVKRADKRRPGDGSATLPDFATFEAAKWRNAKTGFGHFPGVQLRSSGGEKFTALFEIEKVSPEEAAKSSGGFDGYGFSTGGVVPAV